HGLHTSINWASWTITAYSLGLILMLSVAGRLSDRYGRRRFFLASVAVFAGASLCCGLTNNIYLLIVLRAVQAAGGAGFTPSATGIVVDHFGQARDKAVGLFGSIFPIGAITGPIFGGLFVTYWSWRGIFLVNVPIGILLAALCLGFVPRDPPRREVERQPMDVTGMVLLGAGVLAGMVGISYLGEAGARLWSPLFLGPALGAVVALWLFVRHIGHARNPFIPPRLIHGRGFAAVNVINVLYGGALSGIIALVPLYAINRYGMDALRSGTLLTAQGVAVIVLSTLAAFMLRRTGYRRPLYLGGAIAAVGVLALAPSPPIGGPFFWLVAATCLVGIGIGWSSPASRNACLQLAPDQSAPLAALRSTGRQVGQITAVSVTSAILAQAQHPGDVQAYVFVAFAIVLAAGLPVIARVPEHRGAW
ncbi:MAG: MFS transporter, partial [Candidatus Dormibacteraeota bacterium]|nr:MFS transporter [Candidatus Dormibacteraeota bacterium]